ncbi:Similar to ZNF358: Zinc finger protein 358 (Homo sapiens) [Cotesia congregata]|uniref:Similar to ZNF358: Zinc finger protein 358 (Homo sapiens) n=1 Tax=Cotesia congregata TaxID=51543 RepID=A0A8J2HBH8_COTCN|nr:Similar to ZNF358: Zinc finger protein 358 (Homo sapiens) [Cotesia congregata]
MIHSDVSGERPYKCHLPDCGRAFIQLSNLQQHLRNHDAQVERAKNRPFHCSICGKGFATESSLRTHTSKVSHQHAGLIGGPNATSCPICHKLFLGGEALMEHMKITHKDPNASGVATKRRTANHPCPVCGKHYVNEGSLRKHLACHPETSQLSTNLRMWPCSVCQAVYTHESGLLSHMEHMRMDPKHQFAAQYVLSRAAAERRERELLAGSSLGAGLGVLTSQPGGPQNLQQPPMCPSPSAHSESSSGNGRLSSAGSEPGTGLLNNNNNNNNNNMASPGPSGNKLSEMLRAGSQSTAQQYHDEMQSQQQRMAVMAAAVQAAGLQNSVSPNLSSVDVASLAAAMRMGGNNNDINANQQGQTGQQQQGVQNNNSEQALRMHQAEALLRSQAEAALRLAVSQAAAAAASSAVGSDMRHHLGQHNGGGGGSGMPGHHTNQQLSQPDSLSPDLGKSQQQHHQMMMRGLNEDLQSQSANKRVRLTASLIPSSGEALRLQEQRLEQALRLHGDPRALGFTLQHVVNQQNNQQP